MPNKLDPSDVTYTELWFINNSHRFDEWFDPDMYMWSESHYLASHCSSKIETWWYPDKFYWRHCNRLARYCSDHFDIWWDPEYFRYFEVDGLLRHCSDNFPTWFRCDPHTIIHDICVRSALKLFASRTISHIDMWYPYLNIEKTKQEFIVESMYGN